MHTPDRVLAAVHVVLVAPRSAGNIGAVARAIANYGLGRLVLVAPPAFDPDRARWMAPGARDRIDDALIVATVEAAIAQLDVVRVVGTTARTRRLDTPVWGPAQLAQAVHARPEATAIVFGPEDFGLDNASVARCDAVLRIPTAAHASLNLGQAVNVAGAILRSAAVPEPAVPAAPRAPARLRHLLVDDLVSVLGETTYFAGRPDPTATRARIAHAVGRLDLDFDSVATARGMLKSLRHRLRTPSAPGSGASRVGSTKHEPEF